MDVWWVGTGAWDRGQVRVQVMGHSDLTPVPSPTPAPVPVL